ncbi:hypothetical protein KA005_43110 [bacterium]|nr:hypothetical protein [bacterium]
MTESAPETDPDLDLIKAAETKIPEAVKPKFEIKTDKDLQRLITIAKGGDPDAQQAILDFMDLKSNVERSYFPDKKTVICIGQLKGFGETIYRDEDWNPFELVADVLSLGFMGLKGFKSNQFVDMTRTQPDLSGLQTSGEEQKQSAIDRILGRGKE